jgi:GTPase SAR1 family protein
VGGQRTLRPYWRNYFEQTDAIVWVVDSCDRMRMGDCKEELLALLQEDVSERKQSSPMVYSQALLAPCWGVVISLRE